MTTDGDSRVQLAPSFPVLDTMRAVGALAVLTTHTAFQAGDYLRFGVFGSLLSRLDIGVALFFVLSGFLLARPWLARAATRSPGPDLGRYYFKRVLRIYPVYVVTVVVAFTTIKVNHGRSFGEWVTTLLLGDSYVASRLNQGLTQMWSLSVEVAFYVVLPIVMWLAIGTGRVLRAARVLVVLGGLTAVTVWWHLGLAGAITPHTSGNPMMWLPGYLVWFAVGIGFALAHVLGQAERPTLGAGARPVVAGFDAGRVLGAGRRTDAGRGQPDRRPDPALRGHAGAVADQAPAVRGDRRAGRAAGHLPARRGVVVRTGPSWAPLRHLGHISYSIFCIHLPILYGVMAVADYQLFEGHGLQIWALTLVPSPGGGGGRSTGWSSCPSCACGTSVCGARRQPRPTGSRRPATTR